MVSSGRTCDEKAGIRNVGANEDRCHDCPCDDSLSQAQFGDDDPVIGLFRDHDAAAYRLDLSGCVDVVDAEDGEAAVEGVSPAAPDLYECIVESRVSWRWTTSVAPELKSPPKMVGVPGNGEVCSKTWRTTDSSFRLRSRYWL